MWIPGYLSHDCSVWVFTKLAKTILWVKRLTQTDCMHFLKGIANHWEKEKILARVTSRWERIRFSSKILGDRSWTGFLIQGRWGCEHSECGNIQGHSKRNMETGSKYDSKLLKSPFYLELWLPFLVVFCEVLLHKHKTAHNSDASHMTHWH